MVLNDLFRTGHCVGSIPRRSNVTHISCRSTWNLATNRHRALHNCLSNLPVTAW